MSFTTEPHLVRSYDERLASLRDLLTRMGSLAATQFEAAAAALLALDAGIAARWPHGERCIDELDAEIERALLLLLALRAPVASDLRLVL
ncbi:MAG TPA: PhoU domain-containing protein, partial [Plasticicumulans sp.]|nr:PhoU domain-containing protein [Plasticicumulans sp.]